MSRVVDALARIDELLGWDEWKPNGIVRQYYSTLGVSSTKGSALDDVVVKHGATVITPEAAPLYHVQVEAMRDFRRELSAVGIIIIRGLITIFYRSRLQAITGSGRRGGHTSCREACYVTLLPHALLMVSLYPNRRWSLSQWPSLRRGIKCSQTP